MKELMLRLLVPGVEGEPVRARLPRRLVVGGRRHDRLVDQLVAARLVTSDDGVLEIAHESLTRAGPGFVAGSTRTSRAVVRCITSWRRQTGGRAWVGPRASSTGESGSTRH